MYTVARLKAEICQDEEDKEGLLAIKGKDEQGLWRVDVIYGQAQG